MAENEKDEKVTVVQNGQEVNMSKQELQEKAEGASTRVIEAQDGKKHVLSRMNG